MGGVDGRGVPTGLDSIASEPGPSPSSLVHRRWSLWLPGPARRRVRPLRARFFRISLSEVVLTFVFVLAIVGVTSKPEYAAVADLVIGLSLVLVHIMGVPSRRARAGRHTARGTAPRGQRRRTFCSKASVCWRAAGVRAIPRLRKT